MISPVLVICIVITISCQFIFVYVSVFFEQKPPLCVCVLQLSVSLRDFPCMTPALGVVDPPEARRASNDVSVDDV